MTTVEETGTDLSLGKPTHFQFVSLRLWGVSVESQAVPQAHKHAYIGLLSCGTQGQKTLEVR